MDDDFVDIFPSTGGVGDSPVKTRSGAIQGDGIASCTGGNTFHHNNNNSNHHQRPTSLSIPAAMGMETGGAAAAVSPALPYTNRGIAMPSPSPAKESALRSARTVSLDLTDQDNGVALSNSDYRGNTAMVIGPESEPSPPSSPSPRSNPMRFGVAPALTIDPGGECVPTELEKKRAKLERYRLVCSEVGDSFIYVAGEDAAKQEGLVRHVGVTHIINCAGPQCPNYLEYTGRFNFLRLNFYDHRTEDVAWFIYSAFDFIAAAKAKKGRVLIHCVQGVSRSCTLAIAWLMLTTTMDYEEAYQQVRQGRPICAPNTGFICSLLEWEKRRRQLPAAPLMYRTAWHLPNFPKDVVLKLCLHEEDRKHLCPSLAALDSRGCYLIVVPPSPRPSEKPTPTPSRAAGGDERAGDDRDGKPHLSVVGCDAREPAVTVTVTAAGSVGAHVNGCPPPSAAGSTGRPTNSGTPVPESGAAQSESGTASSAATLLVNPNTSAPTLSLPVVARGPAPVAEPAGAQLPVPISVAPAPGSSAAVAAGEAARAAKALEVGAQVGGVIAAVLRGSASSIRDAAKAMVGSSSGPGRGAAAEGALGPSAKAVAAASVGVEVYLWRGSRSHPQMFEVARDGARWLREYEGWGAGTGVAVVEEGQEPPELLRHLELTEGDARQPPIYGDLSAPSPPVTAARTGPGPLFYEHSSNRTPRNAPLPSPAEPPTLSSMGPSPSPGGGDADFSPSPYGIGVSPTGGGVGSMCGVSPAGGGGMCGVSPAGGADMCGVSPAGGGDMCSGDLLLPSISPTGSAVASPAASRLYVSGDGSGGGSAYYGMHLGGSPSRRCSVASTTEEGDEDYEYMLMGARSREGGALTERAPSTSALSSLHDESEITGGIGIGEGGGGLTLHRDHHHHQQQQQGAPRLFELADELDGLQWSELAIFDDQEADGLRHVQSLARDAAVRDGHKQILGTTEVEMAVLVSGDGNEPEEWWDAFESGYT